MTRHCRDPMRQKVYAWERSFLPHEESPAAISLRHPFSREFLEFYREAWVYGFAKYGTACNLLYISATAPPRLRFSVRLQRARAIANYGFSRKDQLEARITFGVYGPTRKTLLHEIAHHLTPRTEGHGPRFCAVALDLYVRYLRVSRDAALHDAFCRCLPIDGIAPEECARASRRHLLGQGQ